ncbi:MAG: cupin domain-containing protein [Cyclobacteriaceae bacterium]
MKTNKKIFFLSLTLCMLFIFSMDTFAQDNKKYGKSISHTADSRQLTWTDCPPFMPDGCKIAVLQGDPAKKNLDVFFKVPPNYDIPNHYHTSPERMVLVSGELHVTYQGEDTQIMKEGTYAYGPAEKPHIAKCQGGDPCILFIAFEDPLDAFPFEVEN